MSILWRSRSEPSYEFTPHKAIQVVADHLIGHLAEIDDRLAGGNPLAGDCTLVTGITQADLAPFTPADFERARRQLTSMVQLWRVKGTFLM